MLPSSEEIEDKIGAVAVGWWSALAVVLFLIVGGALFPGAGRDDAYISYWAAESLAQTGAITNYNSEAVEQSSSLTLVLALGLLRWTSGVSVVTLGWLFGILCGLATIHWTAKLARVASNHAKWLPPLLLALSHPFAYWSFSGMETSLQAALALGWVLSVAESLQRPYRPRAQAKLMAWTLSLLAVRPESPFVLGCVLLGGMLVLPSRKRLVPAWAAFGVSLGLLLASRGMLFGSLLPQPALAKTGRSLSETLESGIRYAHTNFEVSALLFLALTVPLHRLWKERTKAQPPSQVRILCWLFITAQTGFAVLSGGDWMEGARFFAPALPLAFVLLTCTFGRWKKLLWLSLLVPASTWIFASESSRSLRLNETVQVAFETDRLSQSEKRNLVHLRDAPMLEAMEQILSARPSEEPWTVLTGQGGLVLFHSLLEHPRALHVIDRYGLLDRQLLRSPTARASGSSALGLDLSYKYLLEHWDTIFQEAGLKEPDLLFDVGIGIREGNALRERGYELVYQQHGELIVGSRTQAAKQVLYLKRELAELLPQKHLSSFQFSPGRFDG